MLCHSVLVMSKMLETYRGFEDLHSLVDVGGGVGVCLGMITTKYPHIKGINLDLPHVIEAAPSHLGVQHVGGDMFVEIPEAEAMFMKWILHNWSDDHCLQILKNCHQSLPANGKVIALDALLPDQVENSSEAHATYHMDLVMLAFHIGGKERTKDEIKALAITAGFSKLEVIHNVYGMSIMEISK
ncbi:hypothetical protein KP509_1Z068200 [Ceratopteris richardii]|nr:hypothetical protein KP509_1Z068200 [Ceratopteris richardii]